MTRWTDYDETKATTALPVATVKMPAADLPQAPPLTREDLELAMGTMARTMLLCAAIFGIIFAGSLFAAMRVFGP